MVKYLDKKYLGGDLGGGGAALDQSTMVLSAKQLVLIFFIGKIKKFALSTLLEFVFRLINSSIILFLVLAAIGTVLGIFILEKMWSLFNKMIPINDLAEDAIDNMYGESGMPVMLKTKPNIRN